MKRFRLNPAALDKWIHQNKGVVLQVIEGCLLDNLLIATERGVAVIEETYINANMSGYTVTFEAGNGTELYHYWDQITAIPF